MSFGTSFPVVPSQFSRIAVVVTKIRVLPCGGA
jgi:hypothetical protein